MSKDKDINAKNLMMSAFEKAAAIINICPDITLENDQGVRQPLKEYYAEALGVARTPELREWAVSKFENTDVSDQDDVSNIEFFETATRAMEGKSATVTPVDAARLVIDRLNLYMKIVPKKNLG